MELLHSFGASSPSSRTLVGMCRWAGFVVSPFWRLLENEVKVTEDTKENDVSENTSPSPTYKEILVGNVKGKDGQK